MRIILITISALLTSCALVSEPYYYNELVVINHTGDLIRNVAVKADKSNRIFKCSNIAPRAKCSVKFPNRKYLNNPLSITWIFNNIEKTKGNFKLNVPQHLQKSIPIRGILSIQLDGTVKIWFEQSKH